MSAIAEPPTQTKPAAMDLPPLEQAFGEALKAQEAQPGATKPEPAKPEAAKPEAKPAADKLKADPEKPAVKEAAKPDKSAKKKSALEAALSEEPAPEAKPEPDETQQLLESKDPNWERAREVMKRQGEELKTFREKATKANEPTPEVAAKMKSYEKELADIKAQNAALKDSITALDVRYDPDFRAKYDDGRTKLVTQAAAKVEAAGGDKAKFLEAMELSGTKRSQLLKEALAEVEQGFERDAIGTRLGQIDTLEEERDEQLKNPQKTSEEWQRKRDVEAQKQEQAVAEFKTATFDKIAKKLQKESPLFRVAPDDSEGADTYNADLKADMERAIELTGNIPADDVAIASFKAQRFDTITKSLIAESKAKDARISELEETLRKFEGSETGYRGGKKPSAQAPHEVPLEKAFMDALNSQTPI